MQLEEDYIFILNSEFSRRLSRNKAYSLRSFAKSLNVSFGGLSEILSEKRIPSGRVAEKLLDRLDLTPDQRKAFVASLERRYAQAARQRKSKRLVALFRREAASIVGQNVKMQKINNELFDVIGDWENMAVAMLVETRDFKNDVNWIASQLGITSTNARLAISRLLKVGILKLQGRGQLRVCSDYCTTADKSVTSASLRRLQKQVLEKAIDSLENDPIERRSMTSLTMAVDPDKIPKAKAMIEEFTRALCAFLECGEKTEVYQIGFCLYPLQKRRLEK